MSSGFCFDSYSLNPLDLMEWHFAPLSLQGEVPDHKLTFNKWWPLNELHEFYLNVVRVLHLVCHMNTACISEVLEVGEGP